MPTPSNASASSSASSTASSTSGLPLRMGALAPGQRLGEIFNASVWTPSLCHARGRVSLADGRLVEVASVPTPPPGAPPPPSRPASPASPSPPEAAPGVAVGAPVRLDAEGVLVVPGLIDTHMHGAGGGDFLFGEVEQVARARRMTARGATTGLVVVVPYYNTDRDLSRFRAAIAALRASDVPGARLLGVNLETPFLNPVRRGGFPESCCHPVDLGLFHRLVDACEGMARVITVSPELPGVEALIEAALERGVRVALGHSDATAAVARRGFALGADRLTHTFNTMQPLHHREIGLLGAAMLDPGVFLEVIADAIHLCPDALRFLCTLFPAGRLVTITDSNAGAGMPDGFRLRAVGGEAEVRDRAVRLLDGTLAGSTVLMAGAVQNLIRLGGMPPRAAIETATLTPARSLGLDEDYGSLEPGKAADLALLDPKTLDPLATVVGGEVVWVREP